MDLTNLTIGQKLYSAINGEVIFDGYIENPQGEKYLICCKKDKILHYYFLDGKSTLEGMVVLFLSAPVGVVYTTAGSDHDIDKQLSLKQIAEIIDIYNEILNSDYVTEEMLCDNNLMAEEIWQRLQ